MRANATAANNPTPITPSPYATAAPRPPPTALAECERTTNGTAATTPKPSTRLVAAVSPVNASTAPGTPVASPTTTPHAAPNRTIVSVPMTCPSAADALTRRR